MQESLSGVVSGLNIWNKQLNLSQIEAMAECKGNFDCYDYYLVVKRGF